jgi:hypothetical protein
MMRLTLVQPLQIDILVISRVDEVVFIKLEVFGGNKCREIFSSRKRRDGT